MSFWSRLAGKEKRGTLTLRSEAPPTIAPSIQPATSASVNDGLVAKILDWKTGAPGRVEALKLLAKAGDSRLIEVASKAYLETITFGHDNVITTALSILEHIGTDAVPAIAKGLRLPRTEERCARILGRIGGVPGETALEEALREARARLTADPAGVLLEHLVNALESIREPKSAKRREKHESANDKLIQTINDMWAPAGARIEAIRNLHKAGDSRLLRTMTQPFAESNLGGHHDKVIDASLSVLEGIGQDAVPAIASLLPSARAAAVLARVGGPQAILSLEQAIAKYGSNQSPRPAPPPPLLNALQAIRDPLAANEREGREASERAMYERKVLTRDPEQAVSSVFKDMLSIAPRLTSDEADGFLRDWAGNDMSGVSLKRASAKECEATVRGHFQALALRSGFEQFRVELNPRWKCVFVSTFYSGVVNFLLVWRQGDVCVVAHT